MKHLLVLLSPEGDQVGPYALALAKQFDAHPTVIAYAFEPSLPYFATDSLGDVVAQARDAAAHAATQDLAKFESRAKQVGLNVVVTSLVASTERLAHETARLARCHDLMIMQQNQGRGLERSLQVRGLSQGLRHGQRSPALIGRYLNFYNGRRPHSSLDRQTPDQAYFTRLPQSAAA